MVTKSLTQLEDVDVLTVGLVSSGAIGEDFLLLKQDTGGDEMPKDKKVPEGEPEVAEEVEKDNDELSEGLIAKLKSMFATKEEVEELTKVEPEEEPDAEVEKETPDAEVNLEDRIAVVEKRYDERLDKFLEDQKKLQTELGETQAELEKSRDEVEKERDARAEAEFVEKAKAFRALPVDRAELGAKLYTLSKAADQETFDWLLEVMKASDNQAFSAGLFNEMGTAETVANDVLTKVEKAADAEDGSAKEALLSLSAAEQEELLDGIPYEKEKR